MTSAKTTNDRPIAIRIWEQLQDELSHETNPYLAVDRFVLQKDAYLRLSDEDVASDVPWLSYTMDSVTSDEDLDFSFHLFAEGMAFNFGPANLEVPYLGFSSSQTALVEAGDDTPEVNPQAVARNLVLTIRLLLSGQIAVGCSLRNGQVLAVETFLSGYGEHPLVIGLIARFGVFQTKAYDYVVKQNHILRERLTIADDYPLLPPVINGRMTQSGRLVEAIGDLEPLTKKAVERLESEQTLQQLAGKQPDQSNWAFFYSTTEFWMVCLGYIGLIVLLESWSASPAVFRQEWSHLVFIGAGWFVIPALTGVLLLRRQSALNAGRRPLSVRLEDGIRRLAGRPRP